MARKEDVASAKGIGFYDNNNIPLTIWVLNSHFGAMLNFSFFFGGYLWSVSMDATFRIVDVIKPYVDGFNLKSTIVSRVH